MVGSGRRGNATGLRCAPTTVRGRASAARWAHGPPNLRTAAASDDMQRVSLNYKPLTVYRAQVQRAQVQPCACGGPLAKLLLTVKKPMNRPCSNNCRIKSRIKTSPQNSHFSMCDWLRAAGVTADKRPLPPRSTPNVGARPRAVAASARSKGTPPRRAATPTRRPAGKSATPASRTGGIGIPNWFARPNQFIRCFRWPIISS